MFNKNELFQKMSDSPRHSDNRWLLHNKLSYRMMNDGTFEVQVPGFCEDDLSIEIENNICVFILSNETNYCEFRIFIPDDIESLNATIYNGVLTYTMVNRSNHIKVTIGNIV